MSNTISIRSLAKQYGYDESTIRQSWIPKGLDMSWPEEQIRAWVVDEVLRPLRDTDLREQIDRERLRRMTAEATQAELELDKQLGLVVDTAYLESSPHESLNNLTPEEYRLMAETPEISKSAWN